MPLIFLAGLAYGMITARIPSPSAGEGSAFWVSNLAAPYLLLPALAGAWCFRRLATAAAAGGLAGAAMIAGFYGVLGSPTLCPVSNANDVVKRVVLGRALRSDRQSEQELPKRLALPIFASNPLSSVTYATQELLVVLTLGGLAYLYLTPYVTAGVVLLLTVVVLSYRQLVHAYPSGGGDYQVASEKLGRRSGGIVASALLVDYVLTVSVSVSVWVDNIISAAEGLADHRVALALGFVTFLTAVNLRGVKESGKAFAVPTYGFVVGVFAMIAYGLFRAVTGDTPIAESAMFEVVPEEGKASLTGLAFASAVSIDVA